MNNRVKSINSPYDNIQAQINRNTEIVELLQFNEEVDSYDLSAMIPKVTYDDWIVCLYTKDDKLYRIEISSWKSTVLISTEYNPSSFLSQSHLKAMQEELLQQLYILFSDIVLCIICNLLDHLLNLA